MPQSRDGGVERNLILRSVGRLAKLLELEPPELLGP